MPLNVPSGEKVFLDSTIFHYAFVHFPDATPLATNDDDFDRVPDLRVWKPR